MPVELRRPYSGTKQCRWHNNRYQTRVHRTLIFLNIVICVVVGAVNDKRSTTTLTKPPSDCVQMKHSVIIKRMKDFARIVERRRDAERHAVIDERAIARSDASRAYLSAQSRQLPRLNLSRCISSIVALDTTYPAPPAANNTWSTMNNFFKKIAITTHNNSYIDFGLKHSSEIMNIVRIESIDKVFDFVRQNVRVVVGFEKPIEI
jgi:hypothetical protein